MSLPVYDPGLNMPLVQYTLQSDLLRSYTDYDINHESNYTKPSSN